MRIKRVVSPAFTFFTITFGKHVVFGDSINYEESLFARGFVVRMFGRIVMFLSENEIESWVE